MTMHAYSYSVGEKLLINWSNATVLDRCAEQELRKKKGTDQDLDLQR